MELRRFLPCCLFAAAMLTSSCIQDEALNKEAAIDAISGVDVQFTNGLESNSRSISIYINRGADLASQHLTLSVPEGAMIDSNEELPGDREFTQNEDGTYSGVLDFDNANHSRVLTITSEDGANEVSYLFRIIQMELPTSFHFEQLQETNQVYHILLEDQGITPENIFSILQWCSGNPGFELTKMYNTWSDFPTVRMDGGYQSRYCAKLTTCDTGEFGRMIQMYIAAGNLFIGSFDLSNAVQQPLQSTKFGVQFLRKPVSLKGYYKYRRGEVFTEDGVAVEGKQDSFDIYAMLYEADDNAFMLDGANGKTDRSIVLLAAIDQADAVETDQWTEFEIPFVPMNGKTVDEQKLEEGKYKLGIVFSSSIEGNYFKGAVGSTLWVDEVELVCE